MKLYKYINYKFLRSNKVFLGILIIIIGAFLLYKPIIEGFTSKIEEYEYLAPSTDNISDDMWNKLIEKMKQVTKQPDRKITLEQIKGPYKNLRTNKYDISNKDINYYLENGRFPISPYINKMVKNMYEKNRKLYPKNPEKDPSDADIENNIKNLSISATNRQMYGMYYEQLEEDKQSPSPDSYLIYMGTKQPPSYSSIPKLSINKSTTSLTDSLPALDEIEQKSNYNDFISLCKRVR